MSASRPKKATHQDWMQARAARDSEALACARALNAGRDREARDHAIRMGHWDGVMRQQEAELDSGA